MVEQLHARAGKGKMTSCSRTSHIRTLLGTYGRNVIAGSLMGLRQIQQECLLVSRKWFNSDDDPR
ncbi:hypothetical protein HU200_051211 [Digitaria exilis]|uniref:Uncharacterized protein n=1 Tax=Digitaria exilis TaxID=1010633 RepID=A0A835ASR2_9POAL|nr:hypothetical protein HU200_051211 [Digitaria exilis]